MQRKRGPQGWFLFLSLLFSSSAGLAQEAAPTLTAEQQAAQQEKAHKLLSEIAADAAALRLPENRIRIQVTAGDLLWERDQARARALFNEAAAALTALMQSVSGNEMEYFRQVRVPNQLREELLRRVVERDPQLAYEILQATRPPEPPANGPLRGRSSEAELELSLLAKIAAADPALALRRAEELLDKNEFPSTLAEMVGQLRAKDEKAAASLSDKIISKLRPETLLSTAEAGSLAMTFLRPGPFAADSAKNNAAQTKAATASGQVLSEADYRKLLNNVITVALKATPRTNANNQNRAATNGAGNSGAGPTPGVPAGPGGQAGGRGGFGPNQPGRAGFAATPADPAQDNARRMLSNLSSMLTQVDKYAASYGAAVRQKLTETGQGNNNNLRQALGDYGNVIRQGTAEELLQAATAAPATVQPLLYQQAAQKALNEGQPDRARQIASNLPEAQRTQLLQNIERRQQTDAAAISTIEQARQQLARLRNDEERIDQLTRLSASAVQHNNPKFARQLADEARNLVRNRAQSYEQLEAQLKVAHAYTAVSPAQSLEVLETSIERLNDLLPAAALLEGFEVRVFKDGELPLMGGGRLGQMVLRIGQELSELAAKDFERAQATAEKFQRTEPRVAARLAVVQGVLGDPAANTAATNLNQPFGPRGGLPGGGRRP